MQWPPMPFIINTAIYNNSSIEDHQNQITETESNIINNSKLIKKHFCSFDIEEIFKSLKSEKNSFTNETINHLRYFS